MSKRQWYQLDGGGLFEILAVVNEHGGVKQAVTTDEEKRKLLNDLTKGWTYYGNGRVQDYGDVAILKDGSVLACITTASFAGTFASHDDIRVEWWVRDNT
jgi:hypothetical protein